MPKPIFTEEKKAEIEKLWSDAKNVTAEDPAGRFLGKLGFNLKADLEGFFKFHPGLCIATQSGLLCTPAMLMPIYDKHGAPYNLMSFLLTSEGEPIALEDAGISKGDFVFRIFDNGFPLVPKIWPNSTLRLGANSAQWGFVEEFTDLIIASRAAGIPCIMPLGISDDEINYLDIEELALVCIRLNIRWLQTVASILISNGTQFSVLQPIVTEEGWKEACAVDEAKKLRSRADVVSIRA